MVKVTGVPAHKEVITPDNVKQLGENIAVYALKKLSAYKNTRQLEDLYFGLIKDIHNQNNPSYVFTNGYDYAQAASCFLSKHMGKTLGTVIQVKYRKTMRDVTVIHACTSMLGRLYYDGKQYSKFTAPIRRTDGEKSVEFFKEDNAEEQLDRVDEIIQSMHLTDKQMLILNCYMQGMGVTEIREAFGICLSTIWRRRIQLQKRYMEIYG